MTENTQPPIAQRTSGLAIASLVTALLCVPLTPIILGHTARSGIKKDPQLGGGGLALAGLIIGYIQLVAILGFLLLKLPAGLGAANSSPDKSGQSLVSESIEPVANDSSETVVTEGGEPERASEPVAASDPAPVVRRALDGNSFFGTASRGNKFVFIIDKSGSMGGDRLAAAKEELCRTLNGLKATNKFMVYFFSDNAESMPARTMLSGTPENIRWAVKWVRTRSVQGGTDPRQALHWCFKLRPDTVWLLTDGQFSDEGGVLDTIATGNRQLKARINTVAFHVKDGADILQRIARENDGKYRFVK